MKEVSQVYLEERSLVKSSKSSVGIRKNEVPESIITCETVGCNLVLPRNAFFRLRVQ